MLQSLGSQRVGHELVTEQHYCNCQPVTAQEAHSSTCSKTSVIILASKVEGPWQIEHTASGFILMATMSKPGPDKQFCFFPLQDQKERALKGLKKLSIPSVQVSVHVPSPAVNDLEAFSDMGQSSSRRH